MTVRSNLFALGRNDQIKLTNMTKSGTLLLERNVFYWSTGRLFNGSPDEEITFRDNLYWQAGSTGPIRFADGKSLDEWRQAKEPGAVVADPRFANPADGDFRLPADSPVNKIGFETFDVSGAGRLTKLPAHGPPAACARDVPTGSAGAAVPVARGLRVADRGSRDARLWPDGRQPRVQRPCHRRDGGRWQALPEVHRQRRRAPSSSRTCTDISIAITNPACGDRRWTCVSSAARPAFDWRDADPWYKNGPAFEVAADGTLKSNGQELLKVPHGQWFHVELTCGLGPQATGKYQIAVTLPGDRDLRRFERGLPKGFQKLGWVGFSSLAYEPAVYYVDNLVFEQLTDQHPPGGSGVWPR